MNRSQPEQRDALARPLTSAGPERRGEVGKGSLKVIGVGFGRTGTASLREAIERLGFGPCYHMYDVVRSRDRVRQWQDAAAGRPVDWDAVFDGFASVVDWPAAAFWRELAARYPDAKLVLTTRDPDAWYDSACRTIFKRTIKAQHLGPRLGMRALTAISPDLREFARMTDAAIVRRVFAGQVTDRDAAIKAYQRHMAEVRAEIPSERLLVYPVGGGWAPLCDFLGVPTPPGPFPHGNDTGSFGRDEWRWLLRMMLRPVTRLAGART